MTATFKMIDADRIAQGPAVAQRDRSGVPALRGERPQHLVNPASARGLGGG